MADGSISVRMVNPQGRVILVPRANAGTMTQYGFRVVPQQEVGMGGGTRSPIMSRGSVVDQVMNRAPTPNVIPNVVRTPPGPLNDRQYTPYQPAVATTAAPVAPAMTSTEQLLAQRAREAAAAQQAKSAKAPRVVASRSTASTTKPGAAPSARGRTVVGAAAPRVTGAGAAGQGLSPQAQMTYQQMMARSGYRPPSAGGGQMTYQQMMAQSGYSPNAPAPAMAAAPPAFDPVLMGGVADYIAQATPTAPVSPYATMNQYLGTSGPPATSVQNSQQAAAIAVRNATADQLGSAEFRATLDQLLREAGLPSQFGTADAQLAARDYRY